MTRENVLLFIGMAINAEKQHQANIAALKEETGLDYAAVNLYGTPEVHVMDYDMKKICKALAVKPEITEFQHAKYPHKLTLMVEGAKVFCICKEWPEWAV